MDRRAGPPPLPALELAGAVKARSFRWWPTPAAISWSCSSTDVPWERSARSSRPRAPPAAGTPTRSPSYAPTTNDLHLIWDVPYKPGVLRAVGKPGRHRWPARRGAYRGPARRHPSQRGPPNHHRRVPATRRTILFEVVDSAGVSVPRQPTASVGGHRRRSWRSTTQTCRTTSPTVRSPACVQWPRTGDLSAARTGGAPGDRLAPRAAAGDHQRASGARCRTRGRAGRERPRKRAEALTP